MPIPAPLNQTVTVSIVSHGQMGLTLPLLEQLDRFSHGIIDKVVLTINIPEPDVLGDARFRFLIERIENSTPKGFGANHNQAFKRCSAPWFLVLNPDIRFDSDVLIPLVAQAAPDSGLLTPRILEPGKAEPEQHRNIITPLEILARRRPDYVRPDVPAWIPGLFMLFRAETYAAIGGFDERFFMYGEDFDICARLRLRDWQIEVAEDLYAMHEARRASHADHRHLYWHASSLIRLWLSESFRDYRKKVRPEQENSE